MWVLYDDMHSRPVGASVSDVVLTCIRGRFVPSLLCFQRCKADTARDLLRGYILSRRGFIQALDAIHAACVQ